MPAKSDNIEEFRAELRALVLKYDIDICQCRGYYGEPEGVEIFCGEKSAASLDSFGYWDFGNGGAKAEQMRADELA
jgi:hypothetical protein